MMKRALVLVWVLILAAPLVAQAAPQAVGQTAGQAAGEMVRDAVAGVDVAAVTAQLTQAGHPPADVELVTRTLKELQVSTVAGAEVAGPATSQRLRESSAALGQELARKGVPERLIHPVLWLIQDRRFPRVDPSPLFAQLRQIGLDPTAIKKMTDDKIRLYAKDRTDVAEAQYEFISNSLYLPPDYLEPGANPPRLKAQLSTSELNTVIHELDHAEKDNLTNDAEVFGKSLGGAMLAGVRKVALGAIGAGGAGLLASALIPKLVTIAPLVGLGALAAVAVGGAAWGAYKWYTSRDQNPRDAREQRSLNALNGIQKVIREMPEQKEAPGITESRSKAWEVSGYFMGDSVDDMLQQVETIKVHQLYRLKAAKTRAEVEAVLASIEPPPNLANRKFGTPANAGEAFFRVKPVNFPYKDHPELLNQLYVNSLGIQPPADVTELVKRINADPSTFPEMRQFVRDAADRRLKQIEAAGGAATSSPAAPSSPLPPIDRLGPNFNDVPVSR